MQLEFGLSKLHAQEVSIKHFCFDFNLTLMKFNELNCLQISTELVILEKKFLDHFVSLSLNLSEPITFPWKHASKIHYLRNLRKM